MIKHRKSPSSSRDFGADCVRILSICLLFWLHFYLRNGFYYQEVTDFYGFLAVSMRPVFMCCVPLFVILTGYLKCGKKWDLHYYRSIVPILLSWIVISLIHLVYKIYVLHQTADFRTWLLDFLAFKLANYSWYIGMYMGLFLIIPLLNMIWNSCSGRNMHLAVVATLLAVSVLPSTINTLYKESSLVPNYFSSLYYVAYYMIGCYIRTYRPKINRIFSIALVFGLGMFLAAINIHTREEAAKFYSGYSASYNHLITVLMSTLLFLTAYQFSCQKMLLQKTAAAISNVVLEMYLLSYLFDSRIYVMHAGEYTFSGYFKYGLAMTAAVFICSFLSALIVHHGIRILLKLTGFYR